MKNKLRDFVWRWLPLFLWMAAIFFLSNHTKDEIPSFGLWDLLVKKGSHFLAYGALALLAWRGTKEWKRPFLTAFLIAALYAVSDELHQRLVPYRNGTAMDVLIDGLGAATALLVWRQLLNWRFAQWRQEPSSPPQ